jgi:4-hydroxy-2-oxoheptanedioate aldolase
MSTVNRMKNLWNAGKPAIGAWLGLGSAQSAEYLAREDFDFLVIDHEHGCFGEDTEVDQLRAIAGTDTTPIVRIGNNSPNLIKRALDSGALGIIVPHIESAEDAKTIVQEAKYGPLGIRSFGGKRWQLYGDDFQPRANDETLVITLIESHSGVKKATEILSVPGVDACVVGPCDLAITMGLEPDIECRDPRLGEAVDAVLAAAIETSTPLGIHCTSAETAKRRIDQGFKWVTLFFDDYLLVNAARQSVRGMRELLAE